MCELLGMSFNTPVRPSISFKGFRRRGEENPHGWGIAFYPDQSVQICKEHTKVTESLLADYVGRNPNIESKLFIAHVRKASVGTLIHQNTHPFARELKGKDFTFAHNGTLADFDGLPLGRFNPVGSTDSEYAFCYLISAIEDKGLNSWDTESFIWLHKLFKKINGFGKFNCLLSDGSYLFCYCSEGAEGKLFYVKR